MIETALFSKYSIKASVPNSPRAEQVQAILDLMGEDTARFKYWLGRTKHLSPDAIYRMLRQARDGDNPQALFNWLLRNVLK
jgi:hypothetical protein